MIDNNCIKNDNVSFSIKARLKSFVFAWNGIIQFFKKEHNAQLHLASTLLVIALSLLLEVNSVETIFLVFSIGFVWVAEMVNTAIEKTIDLISVEKNPRIKFIKDVAAGAVLVASTVSLIIGAIIFIPKLFAL